MTFGICLVRRCLTKLTHRLIPAQGLRAQSVTARKASGREGEPAGYTESTVGKQQETPAHGIVLLMVKVGILTPINLTQTRLPRHAELYPLVDSNSCQVANPY